MIVAIYCCELIADLLLFCWRMPTHADAGMADWSIQPVRNDRLFVDGRWAKTLAQPSLKAISIDILFLNNQDDRTPDAVS
jgi:hypothetical protein